MSFKVKKYEISSQKLHDGNRIRIVFLSDLHLVEHGSENKDLIDSIHKLDPDVVLIGGDMVVGKTDCSLKAAENLILKLCKSFTVIYGLGNHEQKLKIRKECFGDTYDLYRKKLLLAGVKILDNESLKINLCDETIIVHGLNLPLHYYKRFSRNEISEYDIEKHLGDLKKKENINILLAHHPRYAPSYFKWGADIILSGHVHGGIMRLGKKAVISPDMQLFPKYGYGKIKRGEQTMIVSGGIGEHTIPIRIFNPRELVFIEIK